MAEDYDLMLVKQSALGEVQDEVASIDVEENETFWDIWDKEGVSACKCPDCGRVYVDTNGDGIFVIYIQEAKVIDEYGDNKII